MTPNSCTTGAIYSELAADPDLAEIVEMFVDEMPGRIDDLLKHLDAGQWEELRVAAHRLKGAAGSYGFEPISPAAGRVEDAVRESEPVESIRQLVGDLVGLCERATADAPTS